MTNSRDKGAAGEREFARLCRDQGYDCRRGQQFSGLEGEDVVGLPGIHIECKRVEALNIEKAMIQSRRDAKEGEMPIVAFRRNREKWKVCMDAEDWFKIFREWEAGQDLARREASHKKHSLYLTANIMPAKMPKKTSSYLNLRGPRQCRLMKDV